MNLSVIIPALNEEENLPKLLRVLTSCPEENLEIIVVDGGSTDKTVEVARQFSVKVISSKKGRAVQMNNGAKAAKGDILYFVHSDTIPPKTFFEDIKNAIEEGFPAGCYRLGFDSKHPLLKINTWCTRYKFMWCRGGDQSLFIKKEVFEDLGRFPNDFIIMEEYFLIAKIFKKYPFKIIPKYITASSRKYQKNNYLKVQFSNLIVFNMYRFGYSQQQMYDAYRRMLKF